MNQWLGTDMSEALRERVRAYFLSLPEVTERLGYGAPTFFVRDQKTFLIIDETRDDCLAILCHAPRGAQNILVAQDAARFFVPPSSEREAGLGSGSIMASTGTMSRTSSRTPTAWSHQIRSSLVLIAEGATRKSKTTSAEPN
jgi:hypothetical protein